MAVAATHARRVDPFDLDEPVGWRGVLRRAAAWLDADPAEIFSLALLLTGGLVATAVLWLVTPAADPAATGEPIVSGAAALEGAPVLVHVAGAVARPGLVELRDGDRVADAVAAAGGATSRADLDALNLARIVADGEHLIVPVQSVTGSGAGAAAAPTATGQLPDGRVDLNTATAAQFEALPGIGPVLAARIVDHRDRNGPFTAVGELREISGIGEKLFQSIAELVGVR